MKQSSESIAQKPTEQLILKIGNKIALKTPAINPLDITKIQYYPGTLAEITKIDDKIELTFPDGKKFYNSIEEIEENFVSENIIDKQVISKSINGNNTPPKELHGFLPREADWRKKYIWNITINLIEDGIKEFFCPNCLGELLPDDDKVMLCKVCGQNNKPVKIENDP